MSSLEFVDVAAARAARGVRLVVSGLVPSPWSEAAKGLFKLQQVPALVVRSTRDNAELAAWIAHHNVPVVLYDDEPARVVWSEIVMLAARLGEPGALLSRELEARAGVVGLLHEIAGEDGLGWSARLLMIDAALTSGGAVGFPLPVARYLAAKYGHGPARVEPARARAREVLRALRRALGERAYFHGERPGALDVYAATFLTPLTAISEDDCPRMPPPLRRAFAVAHEQLGADVDPALLAHRQRMLEQHLGYPIEI